MKTRGWGLWRAEWYSLCSAHRNSSPDSTCENCRAGHWVNVYGHNIDSFVYRHWPDFWRWKANRRWFNSRHRFLEKHFPNLRFGRGRG